jgi:hypothetical protein
LSLRPRYGGTTETSWSYCSRFAECRSGTGTGGPTRPPRLLLDDDARLDLLSATLQEALVRPVAGPKQLARLVLDTEDCDEICRAELEGSGMLARLCAHARDDQIVIDERQNFRVDLDPALETVVVARLADAATYAFHIGYPWEEIVAGTRASDENRAAAREIVRRRIT